MLYHVCGSLLPGGDQVRYLMRGSLLWGRSGCYEVCGVLSHRLCYTSHPAVHGHVHLWLWPALLHHVCRCLLP